MISADDRAELLEYLDAALVDAAPSRSVDMRFFFQTITLRDSPDIAISSFSNLLKKLKEIPDLEIFDAAEQPGPIHAQDIDIYFLFNWLISRAQSVGASTAIDNLERYLSEETIELTERLLIKGITLETEIVVGDYTLRSWDSVPKSNDVYQIRARSFWSGKQPHSTVERRHLQSKAHLRPWTPQQYVQPSSIQPLWDVARMASLITGSGLSLFGLMIEGPAWAPWKAYISTFGTDNRRISFPQKFDERSVDELKKLVDIFSNLEENRRERLRLPIDRLSSSREARISLVDRAVDLGISVESLFTPRKLGDGIARTIRSRAAIFLGADEDQRRNISKNMKLFYDLRSAAVHTGRFNNEDLPRQIREEGDKMKIFECVEDYVSNSIRGMICNGEPDWDELDIGNLNKALSKIETS